MELLKSLQPVIGGPLTTYRLGDLVLQTGAHEYIDRYRVLNEKPFSGSILYDYLVAIGYDNYISTHNILSTEDMHQRKLHRKDLCFKTLGNVVNNHKIVHNILPQDDTIYFSIRTGDIVDHPKIYHHCNIFTHNHSKLVDKICNIVQCNNITNIKCITCLRYPNHDKNFPNKNLAWCSHYSSESHQKNIDLLTHLFTVIEKECGMLPELKTSITDPVINVDNDILTMVYNLHTIPDNKNSRFNHVIQAIKSLIVS
mgnify:CR=1 FL=1